MSCTVGSACFCESVYGTRRPFFFLYRPSPDGHGRYGLFTEGDLPPKVREAAEIFMVLSEAVAAVGILAMILDLTCKVI